MHIYYKLKYNFQIDYDKMIYHNHTLLMYD